MWFGARHCGERDGRARTRTTIFLKHAYMINTLGEALKIPEEDSCPN